MEDHIVRATAANANIRAFAAYTKNLTEEARRAHNSSPVITAALGRLMTGAVMMGVMQKGEDEMLTLQIKSGGPVGGMTVTADSKGRVKGYPVHPDVVLPPNAKHKLDVGGAVAPGFLTVIKDMGLKDPYVGEVMLQTGEIADDLTYYFAASEQVPSTVGLGVLMNKDNTVRQAGGFIVQLMPFAGEEIISKLEANLKDLKSVTEMLEEGKSPEDILRTILEGFDVEITDEIPAKFYCNCSKEHFARGLISLGKKELSSIIADKKDITINCQFCKKSYVYSVAELEELYKKL